jgi:nucleoside 2-deoxyribosyltransferase
MKVYLAGPDVFLPDAHDIGQLKREICQRHGLQGLFPLDGDLRDLAGEPRSRAIFSANAALMDEAHAIIANLTPFRGPSADVGTAYELGYMLGSRTKDEKKKICLGYSNIGRNYIDKVRDRMDLRRDDAGRFWDPDNLQVEDFGLPDNLMIVHGLELSGHSLVVPEHPVPDPLRDLAAFETCVAIAARHKAQYPD